MDSSTFWDKVDKSAPDGCWLWLGRLTSKGYGTIWYKDHASTRGRSLRAHRVAWEISCGAIPADLCVLHRCDVRHCVNPAHLFLGTLADNNHDMCRKGRAKSGNTKLNAQQVIAVRLAVGTLRGVAARFGISQRQVGRIRDGEQRSKVCEATA